MNHDLFPSGGLAREPKRWIEPLARAGFAAQGLLYATVGALAALAAFGAGGRITDSKGALRELASQPFGTVLLVLVAIGLAGYGLFRVVQAIRDPEHEAGTGAKGVAMRLGWFLTGILHAGLVIYAIGLARGEAPQSGGGEKTLTARLLAWDPYGQWIVAGIGVAVATYGVLEVVRGIRAKIDRQLAIESLSSGATRRAVVGISRFGMFARGVVFAMIGAFFIYASIRHDPREAKGLGETLAVLHRSESGPILLGTIALGLVAYAVYDFVRARYRTFDNLA